MITSDIMNLHWFNHSLELVQVVLHCFGPNKHKARHANLEKQDPSATQCHMFQQ